MAFCNYCGSKMDSNAQVCPVCGKPVSAAAKKAAPKRTAKKKSAAPTIALFSACGVVILAIAIVFIVGITRYAGGTATSDPADDTEKVYRTVDLSVVEEDIGDYDEIDTVIFTDKSGDTFTSDSVDDGLAVVNLEAGEYTYKAITKNGNKYTGTVTVPSVSSNTATTDKSTGENKSTVVIDQTPIAVTPDTPTKQNQTPAAENNSSAENLPSENNTVNDNESASAGQQSSSDDQTAADQNSSGSENTGNPVFIHFNVKDNGDEDISGCTYTIQRAELSESSAAAYPALASALTADQDSLYETETASIEELMGNSSGINADIVNSYWTRTVAVVRADSTIFSVVYSVDQFIAGSMHGYSYTQTVNYDPQTGEKINLSDVVKNTDLLVSCADEQASDYYKDELQNTVAALVEANGIDSLPWSMDYNGLTVYFNSYDLSMYAAGPFAADFFFADYPDLFDAKWSAVPDDYAVLLCRGTNATGIEFDLGADGSAETYNYNMLITDVLPEFFGSYDEQYVHDNNLTNAVYSGEVELTGVYGVKVGGNNYLCVFAVIPDPASGEKKPVFGTFKANGDSIEMTGIYTGDPVTLGEVITDPSSFSVTDANGSTVTAYISADGQLCLN